MENENINEIEVVIPVNKAIVVDSRVTDVRALLRIPDDMEIEYGNKYRLLFSSKAKLVFEKDGIIDFSCTVVGNDTVLVAPIEKIFGNGVTVEGSWKIDRAYPQWFYDDSSMTDAEKLLNADWSGAINSAILMKRTGEVFIPRGDYYVKSPINVRIGINLIGETGVWQRHTDASDGIMQKYAKYGHRIFGTTILSTFANDTKHKDEESGNYYPLYVLTVNEKSTPQEFGVDIIAQMSNGEVVDPSEPAEPVEPAVEKKTRLVYETDISGMPQGTSVRNIEFVNYYAMSYCKDNDFTSLFGPDGAIKEAYHYVYGAIASQGICFDNVIWRGYRQAVKFENIYSDAKEIRNCCYYFDKGIYQNLQEDKRPEPMYAFDMGFLGDAFLFLHNTVHDGWYNNGLRINCCGGAFIADNIMNSDVLIESCKGVEFKSNHIEGGHTITVIASQANICSNYIEKRTNIPIQLLDHQDGVQGWYDENVVTLNGNIILYIDEAKYRDATKDEIDDPDKIKITQNGVDGFFMENESQYEESAHVADADVSIGENTILKLVNSYTYRSTRSSFGKMYTSGIRMKKVIDKDENDRKESESVDFEEFNDYSYFLSVDSLIGLGFTINKTYTTPVADDISLWGMKLEDNYNKWFAATDNYEYAYQIIWDKKRSIVGVNGDGAFHFNVGGNSAMVFNMTKYVSGPNLFVIGQGKKVGNRAIVRLFRKQQGDNTYQMVDIPISGTKFLYDNGLSVNGYTWGNKVSIPGNATTLPDRIFMNPQLQKILSVSFIGDNVKCIIDKPDDTKSDEDAAQPTVLSGWTCGDMIINVNNKAQGNAIEIVKDQKEDDNNNPIEVL